MVLNYHKPPFKLSEFKIEVTHRCPLACIHCSSDATPSSPLEMDERDCLRILHEAAEMGALEVVFSGGEPLIWPALDKAVEVAHNLGLKVILYTSGNIQSFANKIHSLNRRGLNCCIFSIFGASKQIHERITRVSGSFEISLGALSLAHGAGLQVELHFVPLLDNYKELEGICKLGEEYGVSCISVLRFVPQGRGRLFNRHALNRLQNLELKQSIENLRTKGFRIRTGSPYNFLLLNDQPKCSAGIDRLIIGPDLRIYPCDAFKQIQAEELVGTINLSLLDGVSLEDCWEGSPFLKAVRNYLTTPFMEPCKSCKALENCLSGCLAQKVIAYGDLKKRPDPMCLRG